MAGGYPTAQYSLPADFRPVLDPTINGTPTGLHTFSAQTGQVIQWLTMTINAGDDYAAAGRLTSGLDCFRISAGDSFRRAANVPITSLHVVGISPLSNPQAGVISQTAYSFSGITFSSSSGLLGTCSGSVLPATGTAVGVSGGTLPTGLVQGTLYYLIRISDTTCKLASSYANAIAGTAIAYTDAGSGTTVLAEDRMETCLIAQKELNWDAAYVVQAIEMLAMSYTSGLSFALEAQGVSYA